jgi:hypothetical protein
MYDLSELGWTIIAVAVRQAVVFPGLPERFYFHGGGIVLEFLKRIRRKYKYPQNLTNGSSVNSKPFRQVSLGREFRSRRHRAIPDSSA